MSTSTLALPHLRRPATAPPWLRCPPTPSSRGVPCSALPRLRRSLPAPGQGPRDAAGGRAHRSSEGGTPSRPNRGAHGGHHLLAAGVAAMMSSSAGALPCQAVTPLHQESAAMSVLGDLDPATTKVAMGLAGPALSAFGFLFIARIVMSWYPRLPVTKFPYMVAYAPTEPILAATRKVIPPLGGVNVTPVFWFSLVSFLSEILVGPQGLLVLLSENDGVSS